MAEEEVMLERLLRIGAGQAELRATVSEAQIGQLLAKARQVLLSQAPLVEVEAPVKICGDVHGQFSDLLRLLAVGGYPPDSNYLFLGNYVDGGRQNLETILLLLSYKIKYPDNFFLLRGNHECAAINRVYGFYAECERRYSARLWHMFNELFNCLPFCGLVAGRIFCMHGGLSPQLRDWRQLRSIRRPVDPPNPSLLIDLLWADPDKWVRGYQPNTRGVSYVFGQDVVADFCRRMDVDLVARAHQVVQDGYEFFADRRLVTLFSAPHYCGEFDNAAAVMTVNEELLCSFDVLRPTAALRGDPVRAAALAAAHASSRPQ